MMYDEIINGLECLTGVPKLCKDCPYNIEQFPLCQQICANNAINLIKTQQAEIEICSEVIERQDKKIDELNKILDYNRDKFTERYDRNLKDEAIRDFAEMFDDVLVAMRDEYAHFGRPEYGLVCEVVHHKLLKTMREMTGAEK